ncbi:hypothetical protein D3C86_1616710 [compost metagenome]
MDKTRRTQIFQDLNRLARQLGRVIRQPDVQGFPLTHHVVERFHCLAQRRFRVRAVMIEDINVFQSHTFETLIEA